MTEQVAETWLVLWICAGPFVGTSVLRLFQSHDAVFVFDVRRVVALLGVQAILAIGFVPFLRTRGWTIDRVTKRWEWRDIVRAGGLLLAVWVSAVGIAYARHLVGLPSPASAIRVTGGDPWPLIIALSTLDPVFEEFLYLGFAFNAVKQYGVAVAVVFAACLRVAIHAYQGPGALIGHVVFAGLLTVYYAQTRRLWPVIIAHSLTDIMAFGVIHFRSSI